jgi:hypothetical protein
MQWTDQADTPRPGTIRHRGGRAATACLVVHRTAFGIRLAVPEHVEIDGEFDLAIAGQPGSRRARVVWRRGMTVAAELRPVERLRQSCLMVV